MVRVKFRYLVVNILYPAAGPPPVKNENVPELLQFYAPTSDAFHVGVLLRLIRDSVVELFGDYGMGMTNAALKVNYWSPATSTAIIRCPRDHYQMVWAALTFVTRLPKPAATPVVIRIVRVSGTIKKAEEEVIKRAKLIVRRAKASDINGNKDILESVVKAVDTRRENEDVALAHVDEGDKSESGSD